jgi:uncharacterized protein YndB with AHSA1/START domain
MMSDGKNGKGATTMAKTEFVIKPGVQEITMIREFDAPRDVVFQVMMDPNAIPKWWGPRAYSTKVEKMDARSGGSWRFIHGDDKGNEYGFHGVYHLVEPNHVVQTFEFEGVPGRPALETMKLEDIGGRTRMVQHSVFLSLEDRDGMVQSGMQGGAEETNDRLAELVAERLKEKRRG